MDNLNASNFLSVTDLSAEAMEQLANMAGLALFHLHIPTGEIKMNANTARFAGYEPGELPHSADTKLMLTFEDDRPRLQECVQSVMSGQADHYHLEYRMRRKDGSVLSVAEYAMVYERDENGQPTRFAAIAEDLSRLRWAELKARNLEQDLKRLSANTSDAELAEQNRLLRAANSAANMIIGGLHQDYETVLQLSLQILADSVQADRACIWRNFHEEDGSFHCFLRSEWTNAASLALVHTAPRLAYADFMPDWRERVKNPTIYRALVSDLTGDVSEIPGVSRAHSVMLIPLFLHGEFWGFVEFDDCTRDNRLFTESEADIMGSGTLVIASSISRNETFGKLNEAREAAMASTKAKGEFLSRMSHEIRTPMNAIIGMTTIAKKSDSPERVRYCLNKVDNSSRQLLNLINDILDMSKIEANKLEIVPQSFDFEHMMQSIFDVVQVKMEEKHQDFHFDFDQIVTRYMVSDELRLTQVLINLINNAVKFTPEGGQITLLVRENPLDGENSILHMEVIDTGIGIEEGKQAKLFESFEQADGSITRQYGGSGLGLSICKQIINLMGGKIWVESVYGEGSRFIFEIPFSWSDELPAPLNVTIHPEQIRILVIDDHDDVCEYFRNILQSFSIACDTALSGREAIELVKRNAEENVFYDLIFIDWNMPGLNGGATARELQTITNEDTVMIMMSVADWSDIKQEASSYGVNKFLNKPVLPSVLYNTIVKVTGETFIEESSGEYQNLLNWEDKTILIAEDVAINQEIMQSILEETKVQVVFANDGVEALTSFKENPVQFDLILMDVQMPNMDGLEATRQIRALPFDYASAVPIVAMTANAFSEDEKLCLEAGMNAHLSKPIDVDQVFRVLAGYLDNSK